MDQVTVIVVTGVVGVGLGLSKDVIFSWLKGEKRTVGDAPPDCAEHERRLALVEQSVVRHADDLQRGSQKFDEMGRSVQRIDKNVGILLDRANARRAADYEG